MFWIWRKGLDTIILLQDVGPCCEQTHAAFEVRMKSWPGAGCLGGYCHLRLCHTCIIDVVWTHVRTYVHTYMFACLLVLILMHWRQENDFESKGDKLSFFAECRIRTKVFWNQISRAWMPSDKRNELSRIKLQKLELSSPFPWSASIQPTCPHWRYGFTRGSDDIRVCWWFRIERRQVVSLCWMQD